MRVVGLDLSLTATGAAHEAGAEVVATTARGVVRLARLWSRLSEFTSDAELVVIEDYAFSRGDAHAHELGELGGVVRLGLWSAKVPFVCVNVSSLKRYATGRGNAPKAAVHGAAIRRLGYEGDDHNVADALWLRQMALDWYGDERAATVPADQRAALGKVPWPVLNGRTMTTCGGA